MTGFEPFIDWDEFSDEMLEDLSKTYEDFRSAQKSFDRRKTKKNAIKLLTAQGALSQIATAIHRTLHTVPVMVHIAGEKSTKEGDDGDLLVEQRCTRCGSVLQRWESGYHAMTPAGPVPLDENDLPWWDSGDIVAKSGDENESMSMYQINPERDLEKHERECYSLDSLGLSG
jgi:hypothetical protein